MYELRFTDDARATLVALQQGGPSTAVKLKKVGKALGLLQQNPRHPSLKSHQYESFPGQGEGKIWDSYVENNTPSAWRIYWCYGPNEKTEEGESVPIITVIEIGPHP